MSLPPEWQVRHSKSRGGRVYYFNKLTNETRWDCPVAAVDEDEFPELILPDDSKNDDNNNDCSNSNKNNDCSNSNNNDNSTCIGPDIEHANSTYSPHLSHLNKRRRVDSKKSNSDVKSSLKSERASISEDSHDTLKTRCTRLDSKGKTKHKYIPADKQKPLPVDKQKSLPADKQKSLPSDKRKDRPTKGTKSVYREACLSDLNDYLGGEKSLQKVGIKRRETPPSGGNEKSRDRRTENKSRDQKRGTDLVGADPVSTRESKKVPTTARLSDLKTFLEQSRGTRERSVHSSKSGENTQKPDNHGPSKKVEPSKSGSVSTKSKDDKRTKREIKSSPYMRPNKSGLSKDYKIPKVTAKEDRAVNRKSPPAKQHGKTAGRPEDQPCKVPKTISADRPKKQPDKSIKLLSPEKLPEPIPVSLTKPINSPPQTVLSKRQPELDDTQPTKKIAITSKPPTEKVSPEEVSPENVSPEKVSPENVSPTSGSLIGKIASTSWNFLKRTFSSGTLGETSQTQSSGSDGRGSTTAMISPQTQGQSSRTEYSDDECEMMEIDEVIATVSEIRSSIHNSQSSSDSLLLSPEAVTTSPVSGEHAESWGSWISGHAKEKPENSSEEKKEGEPPVQTFYVLDTNVLIHDLPFVERIVRLSDLESVSIVIPWIVLQELDGLKSANNVGKAARKAIDYLLECRKSRREGVVFEPNSRVRTEVADDRILLCLEWICCEDEKDAEAVLVSCDKNLRLKADVTGYHSYDVSELRTLLGASDGNSSDIPSGTGRVRGRLRSMGAPAKPDPEFTTPVKPRRPKSISTSTPSPQIQVTTASSLRISHSVGVNSSPSIRHNTGSSNSSTIRHKTGSSNSPTIRHNPGGNNNSPSTAVVNSFNTSPPQNRNLRSRDNNNVNPSGSSRSPAPSFPIDMRLAHFTGETSPKPEPRSDIARFDKSVLQVLDEMNGSMTVFRQQVVTFVEAKLSVPGPGLTVQLTELQNFLSVLVPDVNRFLDSSRALNQVAVSQLKHNFSAVVDLVSAIQSYSVHHLHYAPNIAASDAYLWLIEPGHLRQLSATEKHFSELLAEIERAVDTLLTRKQFV